MPTASPSTPYPLSKPLATTIATTHQQSLAKLESTLQQLTEAHRHCGPSGGPITECITHGGPWRLAFKNFYTAGSESQPTWDDDPVDPIKSTWMGCRSPSYIHEIETMFEKEDLGTISERVEQERRQHIKESQNTTAPWEDRKVAKARSRAEELWIVGKDADAYVRETAQKYRNDLELHPVQKSRNEQFEAASTREEQRAVLRGFACTEREGDTAADKVLRGKWTRHFESNMGYVEIEAAMKHDISLAVERVQELDTKLADLQSAYMAETRKKEVEDEERKRIERENERHCESCNRELEVVEEGLCCDKCWQEKRDDDGRLRVGWYCGEECARNDAERHNREFHGAS